MLDYFCGLFHLHFQLLTPKTPKKRPLFALLSSDLEHYSWINQQQCYLIFSQVDVGIILGLKFGGDKEISKGFLALLVTTICLFVAAFGWSWGPLGWTVPSENFPLKTHSVGQAITASMNLLFTFAIAQSFLSFLCTSK